MSFEWSLLSKGLRGGKERSDREESLLREGLAGHSNPSRDKQVKCSKTSKARALPAMPEVEAIEPPPVSDERRTSRTDQNSG